MVNCSADVSRRANAGPEVVVVGDYNQLRGRNGVSDENGIRCDHRIYELLLGQRKCVLEFCDTGFSGAFRCPQDPFELGQCTVFGFGTVVIGKLSGAKPRCSATVTKRVKQVVSGANQETTGKFHNCPDAA